MFAFLDRFLIRSEASRDTAKNRLKLVLMQDRSVIPPAVLERIRAEVLAVLHRYVEIDQGALELNLDRSEGSVALLASVPIVRVREDATQLLAEAVAAEAATGDALTTGAELAGGDGDVAVEVAAVETPYAVAGTAAEAEGSSEPATTEVAAGDAQADEASLARPAGEAALT
jgi:cell division topological specificity factor